MTRVVQLSLLGSILSNMLLVLGCAFLCGGILNHKKEQVFNKVDMLVFVFFFIIFFSFIMYYMWLIQLSMQATASVNSGLLLMAVMGIVFPPILHYTHTEVCVGKSELSFSRFSSRVMLVAYAAIPIFSVKKSKKSLCL